jgi:type VI protein secretion system component VasF
LTEDRLEEIESHRVSPQVRGDAAEDLERRRFVNVVALLAVAALVLIGYWVFNALGHSRRFQRCIDSGRSNCVDFVNPAK